MKKDYSVNNTSNSFGLNIPHLLGYIISLFISLIIFLIFNLKNYYAGMLIIGLIYSFIGLKISGDLLNKYCTNIDINKCKKCKNWDCNRKIPKNN